MTTPQQHAINEQEWRKNGNWSWAGLYSSAADSRIWVPKRNPAFGWTTNVAHTAGRLWLLVPMCVLLITIGVSVWRKTR